MKKFIIVGRPVISNKSFLQVLLKFFGLNWSCLLFVSGVSGLSMHVNFQKLPPFFINFINNVLRLNFIILKILYKKYVLVLRFEKRLGTYKGLRLKLNLPIRGQRTHSNANTARKRSKFI